MAVDTTGAQARALAWEIAHVVGTAKKKFFLRNKKEEESPGGLVVKNLVVVLLWGRFDPSPRNFCVLWARPNK